MFQRNQHNRSRGNAGRNPPNNNINRRGNGRQQQNNSNAQQGLNLQGIMHLSELEQIQKDIREHQLLIGSSDLLDRLNVPAVFHRMDRMFREVQKQEEFLGLILETAKASLRQEQLREMGSLFLRRIFATRLVTNLMNEHISKIRSDPQKRHPPASKIAEHLCELLVLGWRSVPTMMAENFQQAADSTIFTLNFPSIQSATFPSEKTKQLLVEIQQLMQNQFDVTEEQTIANAAKVGQQNNADAYKNNSIGPPPEDFRLVQVAPREQDFLHCSNAEVYLRKAIIVGPYQDDEHYLDVQFRLMREDLYRPLRDGIVQFRQLQAEAKIAGAIRPPKTDLFIYSGVRLDGMELHKENGGLLNYFQLNKSDRSKRMHKRLMFGALVCLSTDQFQHHYVFGVVVDRDKLEKGGFVGINLFGERATGGRRPPIQFNVDYSMVESPAFYEAYKHVLTALQTFPNGTEIPFSKYFVHLDAKVSIPRYLTTIPENAAVLEERDLDFECLLTKRAKEIRQQQNAVASKCKATSIGEHFGAEDFGMDQSQFDALVHAIRSDLAVIQGPPGTGKTFLGLKLVQLLFANEEFWASDVPNEPPKRFLNELRRPMLVVCYTNHALDQFLEGTIPFLEGKGIVRVGGRCKNEELEKFTLGKLRAEQRYRIDDVILDSQNRREYYGCREQLQKILKSREYWKKACHEAGWILEGRHLRDAAGELEINENFEELIDSRTQFRIWLGQAKKEANQMEMDVDFVRMLFSQKGKNELEARALAFMAAGNLELKQLIWHQKSLTRKMWNQMMRTIHQDRKFVEETQHWPKLEKLNEFGGIFEECEDLAVQWLQSVDGDSARIWEHLRQNMGLQIAAGRGGAQQMGNENNQPMELMFDANDQQQFGNEAAGEDDDENDQRNIYADDSDNEDEEEEDWEYLMSLPPNLRQQKMDVKIWMLQNSRLREFFLQRTKAMNEVEARFCLEYDAPWAMPLHDRWRFYRFLADRWEQKENEKQNENATRYSELNQRYQYYRGQTDLAILKRAKVVGMTTTGAARLQCSLRSLKPRIVVVEEAAEVFEPHIVTSLTECCEHLILIGDHQQLRPNPSDYRLGKDYHLDISLFERLVNNGFRFQTLQKQHRMRPEISRPLMPHFYQNLEDDESVFGRDDVQGMQKNVFFINHNEAECSQRKLADGKSKANPFEAEFAVRIAKYLTQQEYGPEQITILCTYVEQMFDVRSRMKTAFPAPASMKGDQAAQIKSIRVDVVDNYQGEECDIIILSLVRSNHPEGKIGFLNIPNRVCVALSRAKLGFFVLGNFDYLSENCHGIQKDLWSGIRQSMVEQNAIGRALPILCKLHEQKQEIEKASEFMEKSPEGGCCRPCDGRLDCGHTCDKLCHAYDIDHTKANCYKKCARMCENGLHQSCQLLCYEECTKCTEIVEKTLKCGHKTNAECWIPIELIICQEKCTKTLACFHECKGFCSAPCPPCNVLTLKVLPCKHQKTMECSQSVATIACKVPVKKCWPVCGHLVETKCNVNPDNVPCPNPCVKIVKEGEEEKDGECTHPCKGTCGQCRNGRLHIECTEECKRILICDHLCGSKCSSGCPPCDRPCETRCGHSQCSLLASEQSGEKQKKIRKWDKQKKAPKGRRCGELCPPCQEPCLNECPHRKCSKRCSEPCDVGPCNEPCAKRLKCTPELSEDGIEDPNLPVHLCAGMCSEKCIEICRICELEKFQEQVVEYLLFGEEDEPDAHFVQLQDCGHYVEVKALDKWVMEKVEQSNEEADRQIIQIPCPKCKTPIRRSKRYISLLNKRAMEIEQVKMKIIGSKSKTKLMDQWTVKQKETVAWLKEWIDSMSGHLTFMHIGQRIIDIRNRIENYPKVNVTAQWMDFTLKNIENFLSKVKNLEEKVRKECPAVITDWMKELAEFKINAYDVQSYMHCDLTNLMERISACPGGALHLITAATFARLSSELGRNEFMLKLFTFLKKVPPPKASPPVAAEPNGNFFGAASPTASDLASQLVENVLEILHKLHGQTQFIDIHAKMEERLKMLADKFGIAGLGIGVQEFLQIHHAFGGNMGQWYVCSKGHPYNIDNCGGAMARGRCPECQEVVGGADHRLVGTSQQANELTTILENVDPRMRQPYNPFVVRYR